MVSNDCKEKCRDFGMLVENIICMADCYEEPIEKFRKSMFYKPEFEDKEKIILEPDVMKSVGLIDKEKYSDIIVLYELYRQPDADKMKEQIKKLGEGQK